MKVYIEKKVRSFCIKEYVSGCVLHDYFASEKDAKKFIKDLGLKYEVVKGPKNFNY